jgi:hypothetical protein
MLFMTNFFYRHKGTKALRKNNKIKSFVSLPWWQIIFGSLQAVGLRAGGRLVRLGIYHNVSLNGL